MKRHKIVIANWKMNLSVPESGVLLGKYVTEIKAEEVDVVVCPSFVDIYSASEILKKADFAVGAQNVHFEDAGPYTGEVSAYQLKGFAEYCIVGHSERRHSFGESDKIVAKKAAACVKHGLKPIVCVGENLHEKLDGLTNLVVSGQLEASLSDLTSEEIANIVIAYEPIWAIGTGHVCEPKKAAEVIRKIRNLIKVLHGESVAEKVHIVYGGSVDDKNAKGFLNYEEIDGFLVGGSSLYHDIFANIVKETEAHAKGPRIKEVVLKRRPQDKLQNDKNSKKNVKKRK